MHSIDSIERMDQDRAQKSVVSEPEIMMVYRPPENALPGRTNRVAVKGGSAPGRRLNVNVREFSSSSSPARYHRKKRK